MKRIKWVAPKLVRKPVCETLQGLGRSLDGIGGELPYVPPTSP
jgi:hypothetical protein